MFLALLVACTEFDVKPAGGGLDVSPPLLSYTAACGPSVDTVTVRPKGYDVVTVRAIDVEGAGWSVDPVDLPRAIAPGESLAITVRGVEGDGQLRVRSDDDEVVVLLGWAADVPPAVTILAPMEEEFVAEGAALTVRAVVTDVDDPPESLAVSIVSEQGEVAATVPDADGRVSVPWAAEHRANGPQIVQVLATDACGREGEDSRFFCQEGPYVLDPVVDDAWRVEGVGARDATSVTLGGAAGVAGAAWDAATIFPGTALDLAFDVGLDGADAEGFAVLLRPTTAPRDPWWSEAACGLGHARCGDEGEAVPGAAIRFERHASPDEPCGDGPRVAWVEAGATSAADACAPLDEGLFDGADHRVEVRVAAGLATVILDGATILDAPALGVPADAWLGLSTFTSAAGERWRFGGSTAVDDGCACDGCSS